MIKLEYFSSTKLLMPIVRIYGLKREGGELFKRDFGKLFQLEQNSLYETQSEIQLAKIFSTKQQSTRKTIGCLYQQSNNN